jgi:glycine/D-amino acid oxidase-like deaminating enzyme
MSSYDAIVIGAGIVGAACAREFVQGGMKTAVVEPGVVAGGATAAGMGHIVVMDDSPAQFALTRYSQSLWKELAKELPAAAEYEPRGTIWVAAGDDEMAEVRRKQQYYADRGVPTETLDQKSLADAEPCLCAGLAGGLLVPEDEVAYAPAVSQFLLQRALQQSATMVQDRALRISSGTVLLGNGAKLHSPRIVNAAGEWAETLTAGIPLRPRKGHLAITDRYPGFLRHQLVELGYLKSAHDSSADSVAFNLQPRITGQILIGSSRQYDVGSSDVDSTILSRMLHRALQFVPGLASKSVIRAWTGFRAATPDQLPLIGPWPEDDTIFLATGHEGLGITTSLGTARLLADYFLERQPVIPFEPYAPQRASLRVHHA